jgi:hypothetical protein
MANFKIKTPHAAIKIWNYSDRLGLEDTVDLNGVEETIISTVSCLSIQTAKSKGNPVGSFEFTLAPNKNWISKITSGSWCCILMSNRKITEDDLNHAKPDMVKMIGKIESVRADIQQVDGVRRTRFVVTGSDWGHIFNNIIYIDNLIASSNDPALQGNSIAVALRMAMFSNGNSPISFAVKDNLASIVSIFGKNLGKFTETGDDINRISNSIYNFIMPDQMVKFLGLVDATGNKNNSTAINDILNIRTGKLVGYNTYDESPESFGFINPFSLQGTNTFWQVLLDNSNPALNEMFNEIQWTNKGPALTLFNRIKPFSYAKENIDERIKNIRSMFQYVNTHNIDSVKVISINAGTNWRDKYNFIEIKPDFSDFNIIANWTKQKTQISDQLAFNREGFRPLIFATKQFPVAMEQTVQSFKADLLESWVLLLKEWFFDTHRLLNGTLVMAGTDDYMAVGNNILFDANLINPTPNMNSAINKNKKNQYVLAHIENISHTFSVDEEGAREYITTIQFVRGIMVDSNRNVVGLGKLDQQPSKILSEEYENTKNTFTVDNSD